MKEPIDFRLSGDRVFSDRERAINRFYNKRYFGRSSTASSSSRS